MTGLALLLGAVARGAAFEIDSERCVVVYDPAGALTEVDYTLLTAVKHDIRALLLTDLPADPGDKVCPAFDAAEGVAACRRCARGIGAHFWARAGLRDTGCNFARGAPDERCRNCGVLVAEHSGVPQ